MHGEGLGAPPPSELYLAFGRMPFPFVTFAARTPLVADWPELLGAAVQAIDAALPLGATGSMDASIRGSLARQRLEATLLGIFGVLALFLALVGVYGVMSYTVSQRRLEIGIRVALGARGGAVARMIVGQALVLAAAGVAVGLAGALALSRLLAGLLYGVSASDPLVFGGVGAALLAVAALAAYLPARRAARVDPMSALRDE